MHERHGYYLIYLRRSRADVEKERLGKFQTLAVHEQELTELARRNRYPVAEVYRELVSGESVEERSEFKKVMERIVDPDCLGIIVHAIDRLGRGDPMEYGYILSSLRFTRTLIVTPNAVYDPNRPADIQQLKMHMFVSNIEFDHIRERLRSGSVASAKRGNYLGSKPPYGYDKVPGKPEIVANSREAPTVRLIFELACKGRNKGAIARHLNDSGIKTRFGGLWAAARISTVLSNPIYKGMVRYGYRKYGVVSRDGLKFTKKITIAKDGDYILVRGNHEPLVSEEEWEIANRRAFEGVPVKRDMSIKNPLAGLIVCGKCGRALIRQEVKNRYGKKYCRLHHAYHTECQCKSISLDYVVDCLCDALEKIASDVETGTVDCGVSQDEVDAVDRALSEEDRRLDKLMELFCADAITVQEFKERRERSDELVRRLRAHRDELLAKDVDREGIVFTTREAIRLLKSDGVSAEAKNTALKAFVDKIEYEEIDQARVNRQVRLTVHIHGLE